MPLNFRNKLHSRIFMNRLIYIEVKFEKKRNNALASIFHKGLD